MKTILVAAVVSLLGIGSDSSAQMSIEQLREVCSSPNGSSSQTACAAYLMGMVHGLQLGTSWTQRGEPFCIPATISAPDAIALFNKSVSRALDVKASVPGHWAATLSDAYPCKDSK